VRLALDRRLILLAVVSGLPASLAALALLWLGSLDTSIKWAMSVAIVAMWLGCTYWLRERIVHPLRTISNVLAALREDDFSIRARGAEPSDPLGAVLHELNLLADTLRTQRLDAQEATALLRGVMAELDVAIFAFDSSERLVLINRYGERLLNQSAQALLGQRANDLGLMRVLRPDDRVQDISFPGASGRWEVRRRKFWQGGQPHELLVLADVSQPLREQERQAWQRLIRVIGHELNNSLAPIKSIAGSLGALISRTPTPDDWRDDMQRGLSIIASRADGLSRFTSAYAQLARLPAPNMQPAPLAMIMRRVTALDRRVSVSLDEGPDVTVNADVAQLEQLLINVLRNAIDAALETSGRVMAGWNVVDGRVAVWIDDEGPGIQSTANLFVPFFTTKPGGSGIGLVLSRQIAEAHGGSLTVEGRSGEGGTRAMLSLPLAHHTESARVG
jgi:two-component system, NtrC family, nitrogen regulation sensor histidine kinase NtrY